VLLATRYGWQMAYIVPGVICMVAAVLFALLVPQEDEAPAKRRSKMLDLPPNVMARVFLVMTCAASLGSIVFNFTTNGNGEMLKARIAELAADPWLLSVVLFCVFTLASLAQLVVGALIDRHPLKMIYLPILICQVPLFVLAAYAEGWVLIGVTTLFMVFVFGAIPFTDAMIVRYVDDRLRSRVTGMRLAIGFGVSSLVTARSVRRSRRRASRPCSWCWAASLPAPRSPSRFCRAKGPPRWRRSSPPNRPLLIALPRLRGRWRGNPRRRGEPQRRCRPFQIMIRNWAQRPRCFPPPSA
jgi:MFS family permease